MDGNRWDRKWERDWQRNRGRHNPAFASFVGVAIIAVGVLFLLQNLEIISVVNFRDYWPVILIAIGLSHFARSRWASGTALTIIGSVFLARNLGYFYTDVWRYVGPILLICGGIFLLLRGIGFGPHAPPFQAFAGSSANPAPVTASENVLDIHLAFSTLERRINSQEFEGGEIHVAFGAAEIDLRNARTKKDEIFLDLHAAFGGIELWVPDSWIVVLHGHAAFGVFEDKTHPGIPEQGKPRLILSGGAAFGGITVKN